MNWKSFLKKIFNTIPRENADGSYTTKYGHRIIPYKVDIVGSGQVETNATQFITQPRAWEIRKMIAPLETSPAGDEALVNETTDEVYLKSNPQKILGKIDAALEKNLLKVLSDEARMAKAVPIKYNPKGFF